MIFRYGRKHVVAGIHKALTKCGCRRYPKMHRKVDPGRTNKRLEIDRKRGKGV